MKNRLINKIVTLLFSMLLFSSYAYSQTLYGDFVKPPRDFKRGLYIGSDSGLIFFFKSHRLLKSPGYNHSFFLGYDILDYLSVETRFRGGISNALQTDPDLKGGMYSFQANGLIRFLYPIKRIFPFIDLGAGLFFTHPTYPTGQNYKLNIEGGYGFEYYTFQRHFSVALRGAYIYIWQLPDAMIANISFKYTF